MDIEMTTPTREQVAQWCTDSGFYPDWAIQNNIPLFERFATLARADLEATIAEQAAEIERLKEDKATAVEKMHESANQFVEFMHGPHSQIATELARTRMALADAEALELGTAETNDRLRQQLAAQALTIKQMRIALYCAKRHLNISSQEYDDAEEALAITTDSTQILDGVRRAERERVAQFVDDNCTYGDTHILVKAIRAME